MSPWISPELAGRAAHLGAYARYSVECACGLAARLHSEQVSQEHLLATLLQDEECAAARVVLHAFADPETLRIELLALCSGIMVVGSGRTLPFSVRAVVALRAARAHAAERAAHEVRPHDLFLCAERELPAEVRERLAALPGSTGVRAPGPEPAGTALPSEGPLFRNFAPSALRALGAACRVAAGLGRESIGPVHLLLGCLELDPGLCASTGLSASRVRLGLAGADEDATPLQERRIPAEEGLGSLLGGLQPGSGTLDLLARVLERGHPETIALLRRQKITPDLVERCRGAFDDPEPPPSFPDRGTGAGAEGVEPGGAAGR